MTKVDELRKLTPKQFYELTGMDNRLRINWEDRYGIPCGRGRKTIDLVAVFERLRDLISNHSRILGGDGSYAEAKLVNLQREIERREQQIVKLKNENQLAMGETLPKELVVERLERMGSIIRTLGERLGRKKQIKGIDAQRMTNDAITKFARELELMADDEEAE